MNNKFSIKKRPNCKLTPWGFNFAIQPLVILKLVKWISLGTFFVSNEQKFVHYCKPKCNAFDKFMLTKLIKNIPRGDNFINLKISDAYITKLKPYEVSLQIT